MKISTAIILLSIWFLRVKITNGHYRRVIRGPPQPPRAPPGPIHHHKKWHMPPHRSQMRPRPIPIHAPKFKAPMGPPISQRYHVPIRNTWKNSQLQKMVSEKPFLSSPTINAHEYDHIQSNIIPTHSNTVKQVDEKGPIHTIPAPNLGPADKPINVDHVNAIQAYQSMYTVKQPYVQQPQYNAIPQQYTHVEIQKSHQYQVTESTEAVPERQKNQIYFAPDPSPVHDLSTTLTEQLNNAPHAEFLVAPQEQLTGTQMTPQELYKLINLNPQQHLLDSYGMPLIQQPQLQQHLQQQNAPQPKYQALLVNPQVYQHAIGTSAKIPVQPQYQLFNYDEQRNLPSNQISRVTADYRINPSFDGDGNVALAQAQLVQNYFDTRDENVASNNVEPDAHVDSKDKLITTAFYSALPAREAEALQEAAKQSNAQATVEVNNKAVPISIYVPDNYDESNEESGRDDAKDDNRSAQNEEYEESETQDDKSERGKVYQSAQYGSRVRPKK